MEDRALNWTRDARSVNVPVPDGWILRESYTVLSEHGDANIIVSTEPTDLTQAEFGLGQIEATEQLPGHREIGRDVIVLAGLREPADLRRFEWQPEDGDPVTQMQLYAVQGGMAMTATATARTANLLDRQHVLLGLLSRISVQAEPDPRADERPVE